MSVRSQQTLLPAFDGCGPIPMVAQNPSANSARVDAADVVAQAKLVAGAAGIPI